MRTKLLVFFTLILSAVFAANAEDYYCFTGTIGKSNVSGSITMYGSNNASVGTVLGSYSYKGFSGALNLKGSWKPAGQGKRSLTLTEVDKKGAVSATWNIVFDDYNMTFMGTMKNKKGKTYRVQLFIE